MAPQAAHRTRDEAHTSTEESRTSPLLHWLALLALMQPRIRLAFWAARVHSCQHCFNLWWSKSPRCFGVRLLYSLSCPVGASSPQDLHHFGPHWAPKWCVGLWQGSGTCVLKCCQSQWPRAAYKRLCPPASLPAVAMGIRLAWGQPHDIRKQALEEPTEGVEGAKGQKLDLGASSGGSLLHLQLPASSLWKMDTSMWSVENSNSYPQEGPRAG